MNSEREVSDLKLTRVECSKCGAIWINEKHIWGGTGNKGSELDLAGLVCNTSHGGGDACINPLKGKVGGQTWEDRLYFLEKKTVSYKNELNRFKDHYDS